MRAPAMKPSLIAANVALLLGSIAMPAVADEAASAQDIETIEVRGIRASLKANLNAKRFADNVVDAITAEDIGKFPDQNVAESLSRITGVSVSREFGEGERITIRGSGPNQNRTLLNGQNVATADWFILDNPSRGFNFTLLPSSLVRALEVSKSPTAKQDEGSIGGTVSMKTRRPLELDANTFNFGVKGVYSDVSKKTDPILDGLYSWKNDDENFGVLLSAHRQERFVQREGIEVLGWTPKDDMGKRAPRDIGNPLFMQERKRTTLFGSVQFAPSNEWDFTFNVLNSKMDSDNANVNLLIRPQNNLDQLVNTVEDGDGNIVAGEVASAGSYEWDFINRESRTETAAYDLDINFTGDSFSAHAQVGYTKAKGGTYNETSWSFVPNPNKLDVDSADTGYSFDLRGKPSVNINVDPTDGTLWAQNWTWGGNKPTTDEEKYGQLDFNFPVDASVFTSIDVGIKYRDHDRTQGRQAYSWHGPGTSMTGDPMSDYMNEIFAQCPTLADCGQSDGVHSVAGNVVSGNVVEQLRGNKGAFWELGFGPQADYAVSDVLGEIWEINEKILAGYAQANFASDSYRGNFGVRVVKTDQTASSYEFSNDSWGLLTVDREWLTPSSLDWVTQKRSYTEVLPSFNFAYNVTEDQLARIAIARVMARPNYSDLAPIVAPGALNVDFPTGIGGNPNLKPQIANQLDLTYEWYFNEESVLSATYFFKDIESYRSSGTRVQEFYDQENDRPVDVTITIPENGKGGQTNGLELGYQHTIGSFGWLANYTYTDAKNDQQRVENAPGSGLVEGTSKHMANAQVFFDNDILGARLMYNYRTEWYKGVNWTGAEVWNDSYGQLDFSSSYQVTDYLSIVLEATNLTDQKIVEYDTDKDRLLSIYQNGRRFVLGANLRF
ncbi:TonB-dependent receptor [Paraferrimonas sedimenticola]|uniref:TonB-dependent receptor n=1 Tax=Paraferrimonas sedimenticola TaxID=375674 RepID=A0AA37RQE9_9GAMM|nr:TonB-dependent receptor [Paraferrimonas sedimenticola]GLP95075.1 TonB-dependent receptor [Paraferrimonas sedimenticola]